MASNVGIALFLLSLFSLGEVGAQQAHSSPSIISPGSLLSPASPPNRSSWPSRSRQFAFGFYQQGDGFTVGIWLVGVLENTVVWTANRDDQPVSSNSVLQFTNEGELVLTNEHGRQKKLILIDSSPDSAATSASMLDSGNFVLHNKSHVIWQSFDHPTDTILGGQMLPSGGHLYSSLSETDHSTGQFHLEMQLDGNLVLYPENTENMPADAYWSSDTAVGVGLHLFLNTTGLLALVNDTSSVTYQALANEESDSKHKNGSIYRATVGFDGVFRLYSHDSHNESTGKLQSPDIVWSKPKNACSTKGFCGLNSYCTYNDDHATCLCLPGSDYIESNRTLGCLRNFTEVKCNEGGKENTSCYHMSSMTNMVLPDVPYSEVQMSSKEECSKSCLEDCNCGVAVFDIDNYCNKQKFPLKYVSRDFQTDTTAFFKVGNITSSTNISNQNSRPIPADPILVVTGRKKAIVQILVLTLGLVILSCAALAIAGFYVFKSRVLSYKQLTDVDGNLGLADGELTLRVFSYNELRRATNGFKEELGKGSFGSVYKGALNKGKKMIAVKRLEKLVEEGEREFRAEMQAIGRTHHKNLVRLLGYSAEGSKRLLVYEYMSNGSLAELIFKAEWQPAWSERVNMALDVARGLLYLHEECKAPIIHCDIKPQNILMDEVWNAKISDFGLAKLLMPDQTRTFTGVRGTRGYLAPEWQKNIPISVKADIYSYGIVLLEIVCCRRNMDVTVRPDEIILSTWVYKCFVGRELHKLVRGEEVEKKTLENMVKVGLWCIQDEPVLRPSMKSVVLMLQGITDVSIPPCPTAASM